VVITCELNAKRHHTSLVRTQGSTGLVASDGIASYEKLSMIDFRILSTLYVDRWGDECLGELIWPDRGDSGEKRRLGIPEFDLLLVILL
jgi:hypothetical protein